MSGKNLVALTQSAVSKEEEGLGADETDFRNISGLCHLYCH